MASAATTATGLVPVASRSLKAGAGVAAAGASTGAAGAGAPIGGASVSLLDASVSSEDVAKAARAGQLAGDDEQRRVLSDPELVECLRDPALQHVLRECSEDGRRLAHYMRNVPEVRAKLLVMQRAGLIQLLPGPGGGPGGGGGGR